MPTERFKRDLAKHLRVREAEVEAFITRLERLLGKGTAKLVADANSVKTLDALFNLQDLEIVLKDAGLESEMERLRKVYANELEEIRNNFADDGVVRTGIFTAVDREAVEVLIQADMDNIGYTFSKVSGDFKSYITRSILVGEPVSTEALLDRVGGKIASQMKAEINTAMASFNRAVTVKKAVDIYGEDPLFEYVGVLDDVTRDFCKGLVGKTFRLSEIKQMDNGQGLDVLSSGGGFNCRHDWRAVPRSKQNGN